MIRARKHIVVERVFAAYVNRLFRRHFHAVRIRGGDHPPDPDRPLLMYGNHSTWWDGFIALLVSRVVLRRSMYVLMEERQLRRYPFFRLLGAFSVVREDPRDSAQALLYARTLLRTPGTVVWIFPQGVMHPSDHRPLVFHGGAAQLALSVPGVRIMPAAVRCDFFGEQRPECFIALGEPETVPDEASVETLTAAMEERVTGILDRLREDILASRFGEFRLLLAGAASTNVRLDHLMGRT